MRSRYRHTTSAPSKSPMRAYPTFRWEEDIAKRQPTSKKILKFNFLKISKQPTNWNSLSLPLELAKPISKIKSTKRRLKDQIQPRNAAKISKVNYFYFIFSYGGRKAGVFRLCANACCLPFASVFEIKRIEWKTSLKTFINKLHIKPDYKSKLHINWGFQFYCCVSPN